MSWIPVATLLLTLVGGVFLVLQHRRGAEVPAAPGLIHGAFGIMSALGVSGILLREGPSSLSPLAVGTEVLLVVALAGGVYLMSEKRRSFRRGDGGRVPVPVAQIHAGIGLAAVALSLAAIWRA